MFWCSVATWAVLIVIAGVMEFFRRDWFIIWFSAGALVALILTLCQVNIYWQAGTFVGVTVLGISVGYTLLHKYFPKVKMADPIADLAAQEEKKNKQDQPADATQPAPKARATKSKKR